MIDCDSALISPLSSRCPSPRSTSVHRFPRSIPRSRSLYFRSPQPTAPTSVPFSAYDHKRLSISTLTRKLHEHTIQNPSALDNNSRPVSPTSPQSASSSSRYPFTGYVLTPPDTDHDDESYLDSTSSPLTSTSLSPSLSPQAQSPFLSPTSVPLDYPSTDLDATLTTMQPPDLTSVRSHRQHISRLQCNPTDLDALRRTLLAEEESLRLSHISCAEDCHPSDLSPQQGPRRRTIAPQRVTPRMRSHIVSDSSTSANTSSPLSSAAGLDLSLRRRKSSAGLLQSSRIEKNYNYHNSSGSSIGRKKSEQGLRRKSLVSAALASLIDRAE